MGQGLGSIIFPPYSEAFGRKKLYVTSTALYSIFSIIVAVVPSLVALGIGRFITGFLSGIPTVIVAGSIEDMFTSGNRIWLIFLWAVAANIGIIVGPIMGVYIAEDLGWYEQSHSKRCLMAFTDAEIFGPFLGNGFFMWQQW